MSYKRTIDKDEILIEKLSKLLYNIAILLSVSETINVLRRLRKTLVNYVQLNFY